MFLDVSKLEIGTTRIERDYDASEIPFDYRDYSLAKRWFFVADVTRNAKDEISIHGQIRGGLQVFCDRCLEPFEFEIEPRFEVYLLPAGTISTASEEELAREQLDENYYRDPRISLADLMSEQIILNVPLKLLCRENCLGLCPTCGTNLNLNPCHCEQGGNDPRLKLLQEIRNRIRKI